MIGTLVLDRARSAGVFVREPGGSTGISFGIGGMFFPVVMVGVVGFSFLGAVMWFLLPLLIAGVLTWTVVRRKLSRGQRTAYGRALTDQVEGFRTYLATAEAEQLQFEEGEDIFSRYLPWAIMFDLTERWTQVCQRLVELGRLPAARADLVLRQLLEHELLRLPDQRLRFLGGRLGGLRPVHERHRVRQQRLVLQWRRRLLRRRWRRRRRRELVAAPRPVRLPATRPCVPRVSGSTRRTVAGVTDG